MEARCAYHLLKYLAIHLINYRFEMNKVDDVCMMDILGGFQQDTLTLLAPKKVVIFQFTLVNV
jgi:hypothetical protein